MTTTHPNPVRARTCSAVGREAVLAAALAAALAAILSGAMIGAPATAAEIYRTVDADGNVAFTDVPPRPGEAAEAVELSNGSTFTPPPAEAAAERPLRWSRLEDEQEAPGDTAAGAYETLEVVSPGNDEAVRENSGNLIISARVVPELRPGHRVQLELDGQIVQTSQTPSFQLEHMDRGTHEVRVHVLDQSGAVVRSSDPSTFHLLRYSKLTAPNRPAVGPSG